MQPRLTVAILVLQAEGLMCAIRYLGFTLQFAPTVIIPKPNKIAFSIGHLARDADLVAVEVVGLLDAFAFFVAPVVDLYQGFSCIAHTLRRDWRIHAGYSLLSTLI